ncbi:MAG: SDR family oxidoreductase [Actinophytocola sp.]|uniref:type I polyketide synthase n=1 Tax=Actinophytocola sp. TaxID=1872138 RepID=UPI00132C21C1|nr:type I polyketide synthase [Actinophytocola sp.]MPZ81183.1 SDR family oxidoreductase [Actinophytocola sp.]
MTSNELAPCDAGADAGDEVSASPDAGTDLAGTDIAIVGMAGRFPGGKDVGELWTNLRDGRNCIVRLSDEELRASGVDPELLADPDYVPAASVLEDVDLFDASFFGYVAREAQLMDPQQRLFLESSWHALENAGIDPSRVDGPVGVFAGAAISTYLLNNLAQHPELLDQVGAVQIGLGNDKDSLATRVAHAFDLTGPCYSIQSYCSTSLVAVAAACTSLVTGESDVVLAGGTAIAVPQKVGYVYEQGGMASPDGLCRAFDASAQGTPIGNGVGVVVLRRLDDALAAGDRVYAVIRGWAVNNDGANKVGFTAPGVRGQAGVVAEALAAAGLEPADIDYVEAHGTGTPLGDAAEIAALQQVFDVDGAGVTRVGSAKTNMGHLDRAAGVTGLMKAALSLHHEVIPPTINFEKANPQLDRSRERIQVVTELTPWPRDEERPRRAGVSAFGIGGTNAHVVLEEPEPVDRADRVPPREHQLLVWSARSRDAASRTAARLADVFAESDVDGKVDTADVAYTLQVGRKTFHERAVAVVSDAADAARAVGEDAPQRVLVRTDANTDRPVGFLLAGVGEHYKGMVGGLHRTEPVFRAAIDECREIFANHLGTDPLADLVAEEKGAGAGLAALLGRDTSDDTAAATEIAQPGVFAVDYALGRLVMSWGITPRVLAGYSVGEFVAAALSEALTLEEAAGLVATRAKLIATLPEGAMAAVPLSTAKLTKLVGPIGDLGLDVAAVNGAGVIVVSGPADAVASLTEKLAEHDIPARALRTTHAFHSRMLRPIADELTGWARENLSPRTPKIPYLSNVTGAPITERQLADPGYWAEHMCRTVRFADMLTELFGADGDDILFLEIGPGQSLGAMARNHPACGTDRWSLLVPTLPAEADPRPDTAVLTETLGKLWLSGVDIDWAAYHEGRMPLKTTVPDYPFERQSYWIDPPSSGKARPAVAAAAPAAQDAEDRFWSPVWSRKAAGTPAAAPANPTWILTDTRVGADLAARLSGAGGAGTVVVRAGDTYAAGPEWTIRPDVREDYARLLADAGTPGEVVHLFGLDADTPARTRALGFDSVANLAAVLGDEVADTLRITVVTENARAVLDTDVPRPYRATVLGACIVGAQEYAGLMIKAVDVLADVDVPALLAEVRADDTDTAVALRDKDRWVMDYRPTPATDEAPIEIVDGGVYLVTGGLGPVGQLIAGHLGAAAKGVTTVLVGRGGLPPEDGWAAIAPDGEAKSLATRVAGVQRLRENGVNAIPAAADVTDEAQLRALVEQVTATHGRLDGVVHLAAVTDASTFGPISDLREESVAIHLAGGKTRGTAAIERVLADHPVDFCVLFSSMSSVLGGIGFAAYVAANTYLDAVPYRHRGEATRWAAINWDTWTSTAEMVDGGGIGDLGASMVEYSMTETEALAAFDAVLANPVPRTVISAGELPKRITQWLVKDTADEPKSVGARMPRPTLAQEFVPPTGERQRQLAEVWEDMLGIDGVGARDNFFDLGGTSLMGLQMVKRIQKVTGVAVSAVNLFEAPTVHAMATLVEQKGAAAPKPKAKPAPRKVQVTEPVREEGPVGRDYREAIAIIGMTGRFPGAPTVDQFWRNLRDGVEAVTTFTEEELLANGVPADIATAPTYVPRRPVLDNVRGFDAGFFGFSPREAEITDPQHRIFMECCWEVLEQGGYGAGDHRGRVGVFGGTNISTYMMRMMMAANANPQEVGEADAYQFVIGNDKDSLATKVSYKLGLDGPSLTVQTFCSTALVALHLACQSLRHDECELALAGGVSIHTPDRVGHLHVPGGMESSDGHVRTFDAAANGTMFGDGAGVVLVKRLADAQRDGDEIIAVIRGSAINNDGSLKVGYTAPSVVGQAAVVVDAMRNAGVRPEDVGYIEAHGTATPLGDPIEVAALTKAFGDTEEKQYCPIGSVKTNIGHLAAAAGATGLIKTALALRNKQIPASLNFETPSPEIDFENSPFYVNTELSDWDVPEGRKRIAGVNALGMGGTNVHVILEEAPAPLPGKGDGGPDRRYELITVSGKSETTANESIGRLVEHLAAKSDLALADVAGTLQTGRETFEHRRVLVTDMTSDVTANAAADNPAPPGLLVRADPTRERPVSFMFAGVGEHFPGMIAELYRREPALRSVVDECAAVLREELGVDLVPLLTAPRTSSAGQQDSLLAMLGRAAAPEDPNRAALARTELAQPAVFVAEYAVARLLMSWGLTPNLMLGYSLGEYVAATLAGVLTLPEALRLVAYRARLIAKLPGGSMLAVPRAPEALRRDFADLFAAGLDVSAVNGPEITVVGGETARIDEFALRLSQQDIPSTKLLTTHAFHTRMLEPARDELVAWVTANIEPQAPKLPYVSNVTGERATEELVTAPEYWARHMCSPVRFADGLTTLLADPDPALLEIGPGQSLSAMTRVHPACVQKRWPLVMAALPASADPRPDDRVLTEAVGQLWLTGVPIDWAALQAGRPLRRVPLPAYPFQRKDYWLEPARTERKPAFGADLISAAGSTGLSDAENPAAALTSMPLLPEADWLHAPVWRQTAPRAAKLPTARWLVFTDTGAADAVSGPLVERLPGTAVLVRPGSEFASGSGEHTAGYTVRPGENADLKAMLRELRDGPGLPERVVHLWSLSGSAVERGIHTLVALAQAASDLGAEKWALDIVTAGSQQVTGAEDVDAENATLLGPVRLVPVEYPGTRCRLVDLDPAELANPDRLVAALAVEVGDAATEALVALRRGRRWVPDFEQLESRERTDLLRENGVYLVTGGLGGIGLAMAEGLAREFHAKLVLFGRTGLPPRDTWDAVLAKPDVKDEVRRRLEGVRTLEELGAEVEIVTGDVGSQSDVDAAVRAAVTRFGGLNGVLHAAGLPGVGLMQFKTRAEIEKVLNPKVAGTLAIDRAVRDLGPDNPVDFIALFSSITSSTGGGPGQVDYCAANAFLDSYALQAAGRPDGPRTIAINWGEWEWNAWASGLTGYSNDVQDFFRGFRKTFGIGFDAGWRSFQRALASDQPLVVVSTQDFAGMVAASGMFTVDLAVAAHTAEAGGSGRHPRPELNTAYVAPAGEVETAIADVWADLLGLQQVGTEDNFFELGGNSLVGVEIMIRIRRRLGIDELAPHVLYEAPTVGALARLLDASAVAESDVDKAAERRDRSASRKANLRKRGKAA